MADGKKSFILYCDILHVVKKLSKDKAGELFVTILEYVNDLEPEVADFSVELVFEPIKQQLKRDLKKWDKYIEKQSANGKLGGRPKKPNNPEKPSVANKSQPFSEETQNNPEKPSQAKKADNVNVNDNVTVSDTVTKDNGRVPNAATAAVGDEKVKQLANRAWANKLWKEQICMGLTITPGELKKWMAGFNSSIASDTIENFDEARYKRMLRGWIAKQQEKGITVETGISKKSDSAPLTKL